MNFKRFYLVERDDLAKLSKARAVAKQFESALHKNFDVYLQNFLSNVEPNIAKLKWVEIPFEEPLGKLRLVFPETDTDRGVEATYAPPASSNKYTATIRIYSKAYRVYVSTIKDYTDKNDKVALRGIINSFKSFTSNLLKTSGIIHEISHAYDDVKFGALKATPKNAELSKLNKTITAMEDSPLKDKLIDRFHKDYINQAGEYNAEFIQAINGIVQDLIDKKLTIKALKDFKVLEDEFWKNFKASRSSIKASNVKRLQKRLYDFFTKLD